MFETIISFVPFIAIVAAVAVILWAVNWLLIHRHTDLGNERKFPSQLRDLEINNYTNMAQNFSSYSRRVKGSILKYVRFDTTKKTS